MVTGNAVATSNSVFSRPVLEDAIAKILNSIECENVFTEELPPITTESDFLDRLVVHKGLPQPEYEGWFMRRDNMSVNANGISNQYQYEMVHGIMVSGLAFHGDFHRSYQYIQDKTEELVWTLEKNKNILGNDTVDFIEGITTSFTFEQIGEMFMYRSETGFNVHRVVLEANGRSFTG